MVTQRKVAKKPARSSRTGSSPRTASALPKKPVAIRTEASTRFRPRFALNPPKIEKFFDRAIAKGSLVTLTLRDESVIADATPLSVEGDAFKVKVTRARTVPKESVKRIDTQF